MHPLHVSLALGIGPVVNHKVAPILEPRNLDHLEVANGFPFLHPQTLDVEVLDFARALALDNASSCR